MQELILESDLVPMVGDTYKLGVCANFRLTVCAVLWMPKRAARLIARSMVVPVSLLATPSHSMRHHAGFLSLLLN